VGEPNDFGILLEMKVENGNKVVDERERMK
jgi:hypothetical protein